MAETSRYDLFLEITQNLEDTEIRELRTYISNKRLLPARGLQQMDPQQIFVKPEHAGKLKKGDLSLLVDLMTKINRDDFAKEAKRIAKQEGKAVPNKSDSSEEELPESPAKRLKLPQPPRQSAMDTSKSDVSIYFDKVVKRVSRNWDELAEKLGFTENDIENLRSDKPDQARRCKAMLRKWKNKYGTGATLQVLQDALISIEQGDTAQELEGGAGQSSVGPEEGASGGLTADDTKPRNQKTKKKGETEPKPDEDSEPLADEGDGKIDVKVEPCDEDFWETIMDEKDPYRMDRKPRGYALILNNTKFTTLPYRKGGAVDLSNMKALLEGLSFETCILEEKKAQEIKDEVRAFSQRAEHRQTDCCVVVLMSHGDAGVIFGTDDSPVQLEDIFSMFDNKNCPRLKGKPKLFFIQACRGGKVDKGDEPDSSAPDVTVNLKSEMRSLLHFSDDESDGPDVTPTRTDMLCGYATQLGYNSFRNRENGSWFIQDITKVFMKNAKDKSLVEMMTKVIDDVSKRTASCPGTTDHGAKEEAEFLYKLHKPLYFFPGL
ncbi:caspase-2-like [Branchiostoma lanceolatum]|uniref:caspase-2-like n=1 Tax=Branchiostoma lanceolatum TaxID=7740 RepID=UPI003454D859